MPRLRLNAVVPAILAVTVLTFGGTSAAGWTPGTESTGLTITDAPLVWDADTREAWASKVIAPGTCINLSGEELPIETLSNVWPGVATSPDGSRVFVSGVLHCSHSITGWVVAAFEASLGLQLWFAKEESPDAFAAALAVSPDGSRLFVTGAAWTTDGTGFLTVAYDTTLGIEVWRSVYQVDSAVDMAYALAVSPDGSRVYVAGESRTGAGSLQAPDYATVAYDTSTGEELWVARYGHQEATQDVAKAIAVSPDGSTVYVTGRSTGQGSNLDYATVAYDAINGTELWAARYNGPANSVDAASAVRVAPDGSRVYVTGTSVGLATGDDYATIAYGASDGDEVWVARYGGPGSGRDFAHGLAVAPDGEAVYVTGKSTGLGTASDYATVAYDATTGIQNWVGRYDGPVSGSDIANAVRISPDGSELYVVGESLGMEGTLDAVTIAYATDTGAQRWLTRHHEPLGSGSGAPQTSFKPLSMVALGPNHARVYVGADVIDPLGREAITLIAYEGGGGQGAQIAPDPRRPS